MIKRSELVAVLHSESANDDCPMMLAMVPAYVDGLREILEHILSKQSEFNLLTCVQLVDFSKIDGGGGCGDSVDKCHSFDEFDAMLAKY